MRGRDLAVDVLLGAAVAAVVAGAVAADVGGTAPAARPLGYLFAAVLGGSMLLRRRFPLPVLLGTAVGLVVYYRAGLPPIGLAVPMAAALYSAAEAGHLRWAGGTAAALVLAATSARIAEGDDPALVFGLELGSTALSMLAVVALGDGVRSRRMLRAAQRREAERAAEDREREAARRVQDERLRIARELHDSLAHSITVISVQASVAAEALPGEPDAAGAALDAIRTAGSAALADLRGTLDVLRSGTDPADRGPAGGVAQLDELARSTSAGGLPVTVRVDGEPVRLPSAVDSAVYRIVQEALTNALRHAGAGRAEVRLRYADRLRVSVVDDGQGADGAGRGLGLLGMGERAELLGGTLRAGPDPGGGFRVEAVLPLTRSGAR